MFTHCYLRVTAVLNNFSNITAINAGSTSGNSITLPNNTSTITLTSSDAAKSYNGYIKVNGLSLLFNNISSQIGGINNTLILENIATTVTLNNQNTSGLNGTVNMIM